ncbi:MAG: protein-export chaperone SecB [Gammaproteobacteria bacterium]|nr:protein-export chaperone SecB [Gammaproteobacteria bacterium]
MNTEKQTEESNGLTDSQAQFSIEKIYVKDLSFETPNSPQIFQKKWEPVVNLDLANSASSLSDDFYEVVLSITVTVSFEKETVYLVEVQQGGIFNILNVPKDILNRMLNTVCPNILFPFAREVISDLVTKGGFPQLILAPVNFDAIYQQQSSENITSN